MKKFISFVFAAVMMAVPVSAHEGHDDEAELRRLLNHFLTSTEVPAEPKHERLWADDLIYSSSDGTRFGKAKLMAGVREGDKNPAPADQTATYRGEDMVVRLFGDMAIVTFRMVGTYSCLLYTSDAADE